MGLIQYLGAYFRSDSSATSLFFGTRHLERLYDNWQKSEKKANEFQKLYAQTGKPRYFAKWKKLEGRTIEFKERYLRQFKAEEGIVLEPGTKEHEEYRAKNPDVWDEKYKNANIILHPEYGQHF